MEREAYVVNTRNAFRILPKSTQPKSLLPWIWYAPTLPGLPGTEETWMFERFLESGIAIAGIDVGESYGSPAGTLHFSELYGHLVKELGWSPRPGLLARSRGGLMMYNWATEHPQQVACIAGIYPVCNLNSYPGLDEACHAYGVDRDALESTLNQHNPIDRLIPLAEIRIPIFHIHGDNDVVVPIEQNSQIVYERYLDLGGPMCLEVVDGGGHDMWLGWFESQRLVDFMIEHVLRESAESR